MNLSLTRHAEQRKREMRVGQGLLELIVRDPETSYEQVYEGNKLRRVYIRGDLVVVLAKDSDTVITIMYNNPGEYVPREERARRRA